MVNRPQFVRYAFGITCDPSESYSDGLIFTNGVGSRPIHRAFDIYRAVAWFGAKQSLKSAGQVAMALFLGDPDLFSSNKSGNNHIPVTLLNDYGEGLKAIYYSHQESP